MSAKKAIAYMLSLYSYDKIFHLKHHYSKKLHFKNRKIKGIDNTFRFC